MGCNCAKIPHSRRLSRNFHPQKSQKTKNELTIGFSTRKLSFLRFSKMCRKMKELWVWKVYKRKTRFRAHKNNLYTPPFDLRNFTIYIFTLESLKTQKIRLKIFTHLDTHFGEILSLILDLEFTFFSSEKVKN